MTLAVQHHQAGRFADAETLYRRILAAEPNHADALHLLGVIAYQTKQYQSAVELIGRATALNPNYAEAYSNLGLALQETGRLDEAIAAFGKSIALKPGFAKAYSNLGNAFRDKGQLDQAVAEYRRAIELAPDYAEAYSNLGLALYDQGQFDQAVASCRRAVALNAGLPEAQNNLALALRDQGQLDESIAACRRAIELRPNYAGAYSNLGLALHNQGQFDQALGAFRQAIALNPNLSVAHINLAMTLLLNGDFKRGLQEYEWRWKYKDFPSPPRNFPQPRWDGGALENRTLLLHAEQGLGDTMQFIRYLPLMAQRGGRIIIECHTDLQRLFQKMPEKCQIVARGEPLPAFDRHCPVLSLPLVFGTTLENIPQTVPYLHAEAQDVKKFKQRMKKHWPKMKMGKVGLVWAGRPTHKNDRDRSIKLSMLAPLSLVPGVRFFSLQKGAASAQAKTPPAGMELVDWTAELKDFADNAALIANLDLVISVDTAMAHLAGAMGKPVWTLLPKIPDWRWLLEREESPWYPSMRLFRQPKRGDWESVIKRVADELNVWIKNRDTA
jgi:Flp pilus assembly protein TadD